MPVKSAKRQHRVQHRRRHKTLARLVSRKPLVRAEVEAAFRNDTRFPPLLSLDQAAQLAHLASATIKRLVSEGYFRNSVRRGKPIAFWRDRFVMEIMELDKARKRNKNSKLQKGGQQK